MNAPAPAWKSCRPTYPYSSAAVFGGTLTGWDAFTVTFGASTLASGAALTVINLSERQVTGALCKLAKEWGCGVREDMVAPGETTVDLAAYVQADGLVDFILDVLYPEGDSDSVRELREDRTLLRTVAELLKTRITARRLRSGLRVILRESERDNDHLHLSLEERTALAARYGDERRQRTDVIERAARLDDELREFVALEDPASLLPESAGAAGGLRIIEVARTKTHYDLDFSRRILVQATLRRLRNGPTQRSQAEAILILGADAMRSASLDAIADLAQSTGVRVTLVFAHLRDDVVDALGAAGGAVAFMRLTDPREAAVAADYIGKDEKMVIGQRTRSRSENYAQQAGTMTNQASGQNQSLGPGFGASIGSNVTLTAGTQNSETRGETITMSVTDQRVIEELIRPTVIQGLPETGLLLVNLAERTAVFADCDPTLVTIDA
jgi:hypothetical protein